MPALYRTVLTVDMKPISAHTHGVLDYVSVAALLALPRVLRLDSPAKTMLTASALGALVYSALTRYELGLLKILPMKMHLLLDCISGLSLALMPALLRSHFRHRQDRSDAELLVGIGLYEVVVPLLTQTKPGTAER